MEKEDKYMKINESKKSFSRDFYLVFSKAAREVSGSYCL